MFRAMLLPATFLAAAPALCEEAPKIQTLLVPDGMWKQGAEGQPMACVRLLPPKQTWRCVRFECAEAYLPPQACLDTRSNGRAKVVDAKLAGAMASPLMISFYLVPAPAESVAEAPVCSGRQNASTTVQETP
jgi:hypothetical protein